MSRDRVGLPGVEVLVSYEGGIRRDEASCSAESRSWVPTDEGNMDEGAVLNESSEGSGIMAPEAPMTCGVV